MIFGVFALWIPFYLENSKASRASQRSRWTAHFMCRRWQSCPSLLMGNQGGKALKWLPAHFNFCGSMSTSSGHFVPKSGMGRRTGVFIYVLSADESNLALAAPRHAITVLFFCCFKCPCPLRWQPHFRSNADRAYNTLHFASKVVCQGASPFGNPWQQNRLNIPHFPGAWYSAFICCQQPPFRGLRVVPCKLT